MGHMHRIRCAVRQRFSEQCYAVAEQSFSGSIKFEDFRDRILFYYLHQYLQLNYMLFIPYKKSVFELTISKNKPNPNSPNKLGTKAIMPTTIRKIVYACSHELPNLSFQAPKKPSVMTRLKRALTFTETIRTPSLELCPYCKREREEKAEREAEKRRTQVPTRSETSPRHGHPLPPTQRPQTIHSQPRRHNTVAARRPVSPVSPVSPTSESGFESEADLNSALPSRNPYRDSNMERLTAEYHARDMEERLRDSLARESPVDKRARLFREEKVRKEWRARDAAREHNEFIQDQAPPAARPTDLKELFIQARTPHTSMAPSTESETPRLDLRARAAKIKEEKAIKEQRTKARCQLVRKE